MFSMTLLCDALINIVFVEDVVKVLQMLVLRDTPEMKTYNVSGDDSFMVVELIDIVKKKMILRSQQKIKVSYNNSESPFYDIDFQLDNTKICNDLGINFTKIDDGLGKYLRWYFE